MNFPRIPERQGLYDPALEKDSCGVGFVVNIKGVQSHDLISDGLHVLIQLAHRGATGADANVGDGAGILMQIPDRFFRAQAASLGFKLPPAGRYGVGMLFLPQDDALRARCEALVGDTIAAEGQRVLGWRDVPVVDDKLGDASRLTRPLIRQVFVAPGKAQADLAGFDRKLYVIRRLVEKAALAEKLKGFTVPSFSARTVVYKGMLTAKQLERFYPDLNEPSMETAIALVHARYSTNTFPSWPLSHPFRMLGHNGEINTLRGNINWMTAREKNLRSRLFGDDLPKVFPVIDPTGSDSAIFDQVLEFLVQTGRSLPHAMMMMIPEAWDNNPHMDEHLKAFYQYHATLMEPWDGPAAMAFSDGTVVGATLDRNGLRPGRIVVTKDDKVIMASEVGVLPVAPENVRFKMRLQPGHMFVVDLAEKRIIADEELKRRMAAMHPFRDWVEQNTIHMRDLHEPPGVHQPDHATVLQRQQVFGYTKEDLKLILGPMARMGEEPVGSMGFDQPIAVLSNKAKLLFNYFKQNFAQVTNPAIDSTREDLVMSLTTFVGREGDLLDEVPRNAHVLHLPHPIVTNYNLERLRNVSQGDFQAKTLPILFPVDADAGAMERALEELNARVDEAVQQGYSLIILTDRGVDRDTAPIPSLLAVGSVHHHLIRRGTRNNVGLIVETGEAREVHHFALLLGYGATAINPYLAFETLVDEETELKTSAEGEVPKPIQNYMKALGKGLLKVFSKMGISTLQSYHGAQIFEALGLSQAVIDRFFTGTHSRIAGVGLAELCEEVLRRHRYAYPEGVRSNPFLDVGGQYQFRRDGEFHAVNPQTVHALQRAVREESAEQYARFAELVNRSDKQVGNLRGLLEFKPREPVPLEEVEPAEAIVRRFCTGAMSLGSIGREAHETLAIAMNRLGGKSNTGEGGEDPVRFTPDDNGDSRNSFIKQVASGRFGVNSNYLVHARELQIKIAQGAKPGEGGQLPGHKVDDYIGSIRFTTPGVGLISPPPHHDIYSIEDLKQLIFDLKNSNPQAEISVKLVSETGVGTVAAGVAKGKADAVLISGTEGGTGASPLSSIQHAGTPWELGLAETQQTLVLNNLRGRIRVQTDGQLKTGRDVVIATLLGAEEYGFSTIPLIALGCIMMRVCHLNTCPVGIATQDPRLRKKFAGAPEHVTRYFHFVADDVRRLMAQLGFRTINEMVGRVDVLDTRRAINHWKAHGLDLSPILHRPVVPDWVATYKTESQDHGIAEVLDHKLIELARPALEQRQPVYHELPISNSNLATGTMLGSHLSRRYGADGLPDNTIHFRFSGAAGQSFGAFLPRGITLTLAGDANDYTGKGLSGGRLIVFPPPGSTFPPEESILVGNVVLYGATAGEAFFNGLAGERFCVRNSGAHAVVEGVGDHGCEYMTGGRVVVLGPTGRNFAAGMSGGIAYVLDEHARFASHCNQQMVALEELQAEDLELVNGLIAKHVQYTGSALGNRVLERWEALRHKFVKVMPVDYKRVLLQRKGERREIA
jgi:glutamate synthase domain-containing protein 2/glutamate synthase domain-containing protein 1/glutamate synthase domain-containing protein 3